MHWYLSGRLALVRKLAHQYLPFSAHSATGEDRLLLADIVKGWRLKIHDGPSDFLFFTDRLPASETLLRLSRPGALVCLETRSYDTALALIEGYRSAGFDVELSLHYGFFVRLFTAPFRLLGIEPDLERPPIGPVNAFFRLLLRLELPLLPYIRFLTGEGCLVLLRRHPPVEKSLYDLSIVIPAYNEERRIAPFLRGIGEHFPGKDFKVEVLVVDDGSHDSTAQVSAEALPGVRIVPLYRNFGKGGAARRCGCSSTTVAGTERRR